jgi:hypothetical protein
MLAFSPRPWSSGPKARGECQAVAAYLAGLALQPTLDAAQRSACARGSSHASSQCGGPLAIGEGSVSVKVHQHFERSLRRCGTGESAWARVHDGGRVLFRGASELRWTSLQLGLEEIGAEVAQAELSTIRWQGQWRMMCGRAAPVMSCEGGGVSLFWVDPK